VSMKFLFSLIAVALLVGTQGQKHRAKGKGRGGRGGNSVEAATAEPAQVAVPNVTSANFNVTDKTQFSRRQWMEIAINQFFDDFENGITSNAPYIFAPGAPYISNGALYVGLDMSDYRTWDVIPKKMRTNREFSIFNRTETWVRCLGTYPDGHQALEFTSFTFDNKGMITVMSKLENKECSTSAGQAPTGTTPPATPPATLYDQTVSFALTTPATSMTMTTPATTQTMTNPTTTLTAAQPTTTTATPITQSMGTTVAGGATTATTALHSPVVVALPPVVNPAINASQAQTPQINTRSNVNITSMSPPPATTGGKGKGKGKM